MADDAVDIEGLLVRYGATTAVDGVSLTVARGRVLALLGNNGAGKTSLLQVCEGFRRADGGSVRVLVAELPFVTLLLRVRGNSPVEQDALRRRLEFDRIVTGLVRAAAAEGAVRPDIDPALTSRLLFGTVNSLVEWYRPARRSVPLADMVCTMAFDGLRTR